MMFGADHQYPPPALNHLTPLTPKASGKQEQQLSDVTDPGFGGDKVCQSARMSKADLDSRDHQALTQVLLSYTLTARAWLCIYAATDC